jgi:hypothetical protein
MLTLSTPKERIVGILHDVIEDTNFTEQMLREEGCTNEIIIAILSVTKLKDEKWLDFIERASNNHIGSRVKRADISDNASPVKLFKLDPETRERLFKKYSQAIQFLDNKQHG